MHTYPRGGWRWTICEILYIPFADETVGVVLLRCPECGYELELDQDECPNCGAIIGDYEDGEEFE